VCAAPPSWGRHPQTFTLADIAHAHAGKKKPLGGGFLFHRPWLYAELS
jgi:hypothetical protein